MFDGLLVIDADSHKMENPLVFFDYLEPPYRDRLSSQTDRYGQQRLVIHDFNPRTGRNDLERVFPQPDGAGKGAFSAIHPETAIGAIFNRIRIEHMDREGIDGQVLYGSMTLSFEAILDRDLAVACMRAYNDYIAEDCRAYPRRLFPVAYLSLVDIAEVVAELRRASHAASKGNRADRRRRRPSRAPPRGGWEPPTDGGGRSVGRPGAPAGAVEKRSRESRACFRSFYD